MEGYKGGIFVFMQKIRGIFNIDSMTTLSELDKFIEANPDDPPQPISFPGSSMIPTGIISEPIIKGQAENSSPVIGKDDFQKVINVSIQFSTTSNLNNLNFNYTLRL